MQISAVIITKNSADTIKNCIESLLSVSDEIILVDSGSTDNTLEIARSYACKIINTPWLGYGATKNLGHKQALFPYILSLDSDEVLSEAAKAEIESVKSTLNGLYAFNRLNNYCGKWIRYGAWYPDRKIRLFPKETRWNDARSHEQLILPVKPLVTLFKAPILHFAYRSKAELKSKTYLYASLGAENKKNYSKLLALVKMIFSPLFSFVKSYIVKLGFLDGKSGFEISALNAWGSFLKYRKLI